MGTAVVETIGVAVGLHLYFLDGVGVEGIAADGSESALVVVDVVDSLGRVVPNADHIVSFSPADDSAVKVVGTANGDPACHTSSISATRAAFHGRVLAVVRASQPNVTGLVGVRASS